MPPEFPAVTAIILAGGKSTRLGFDKTELKLYGPGTVLEGIVRKLKPLSAEVLIVSGRQLRVPAGTKVVPDIELGKGSIRGIYSGLVHSTTEYVLVVACDMPFLNVKLLKHMLEKPRDYDVLVPRLKVPGGGTRVESLHAVYSKRCIQVIEEQSRSGAATIREFYPRVVTRYMEEAEVDAIDPEHLSFFNINTPEDLAFARSIVDKEEEHKT